MNPPEVRPEPVSFTVHSVALPSGRDDDLRRTRNGRAKMLLVLLICAAPVVASYLSYFVIRPEGRSNHGELITPSRPLPASLPLTALDGKAVVPAALKGQWLLVVVSAADCAADCEKRLYVQRQLRETLGRERERLDKLWLITDDGPLAPALQQALEATPAMWILRSDPRAVAAWLVPTAGRSFEQQFYLVDPQGDWMMRFAGDSDPKGISRDLERLLRASVSWDPPGR